MKKIYFMAAVVFTLSQSPSFAQVYQSYIFQFDEINDQNEWTLYREGDEGLYAWNFGNFGYSEPKSIDHNYPVGGSTLTDDWYVSIPLQFNHGGKIDSLRHSFAGFGVPGPGDTVAIYLLSGSPDPTLATKTLLFDFRNADYNSDGNWRVTTDIDIPAIGGNCYIAFRYSTVVNWLDVKFDNLFMRGLQFASVGEEIASKIKLFPNPANDQINVELGDISQANFKLFDASGKQVMNQSILDGNSIKIEQAAGNYSYLISDKEGIILKSSTLIITGH